MRLGEAQQRAARARYGELEQKRYGRAWSTQEIMLGSVGDVGDLAKLAQGAAKKPGCSGETRLLGVGGRAPTGARRCRRRRWR